MRLADHLSTVATLVAVGALAYVFVPRGERPDLEVTPANEVVVQTPERPATGPGGGPPEPDAGWVEQAAARTGVPVTAVRAYARGSLTVPASCRLGWTTLAAIGWVESHHGSLGGRTLGEDGRPSSPILGPRLDGSGDFAAIRATPEGTAMHGDAEWERAVGPMQFLPGTWESWGSDADRTGQADPHDLDDAASAAARYLCHAGTDLGTAEGWSAAVRAYNHSDAYVAQVNAVANEYASR